MPSPTWFQVTSLICAAIAGICMPLILVLMSWARQERKDITKALVILEKAVSRQNGRLDAMEARLVDHHEDIRQLQGNG